MAMIAFMIGLLALAGLGQAKFELAKLRGDVEALRAELRGTRPADAVPGVAPESAGA
ncbi:MAG: hypothetical protein K2X91_01060 [Thermoleophilia bacterium]|nr:hypothetical protein [Thermoleophilia bacterium]